MATPEFIKIGAVSAVANDKQQFNLNVKRGGTYKRLWLRIFNGSSAATISAAITAISTISLRAGQNSGEKTIIDRAKPRFLWMLETYYGAYKGVTNTPGVLPIDPASVLGLSAYDRNVYSIGTADLLSLSLDIEFGAAVTGVTSVELWAEYDAFNVQPLGAYVEMRRVNPAIAANATELEINNLPRFNSGVGIAALHIEQLNSSVIGSIDIQLEGKDRIYPDVPTAILNKKLFAARRTPQSTITHVDFSADDFVGAFLRGGMGQWKVTPKFSTAPTANGNLPIWVVAMHLPAKV